MLDDLCHALKILLVSIQKGLMANVKIKINF